MARLVDVKTWEERFDEKYQKYVPEHVKALLEEAKRRKVAEVAAQSPHDFCLTWYTNEEFAHFRTMPEYVAKRIRENFVVRESFELLYEVHHVCDEGVWTIRHTGRREESISITHKLAMQLLAPPDGEE